MTDHSFYIKTTARKDKDWRVSPRPPHMLLVSMSLESGVRLCGISSFMRSSLFVFYSRVQRRRHEHVVYQVWKNRQTSPSKTKPVLLESRERSEQCLGMEDSAEKSYLYIG